MRQYQNSNRFARVWRYQNAKKIKMLELTETGLIIIGVVAAVLLAAASLAALAAVIAASYLTGRLKAAETHLLSERRDKKRLNRQLVMWQTVYVRSKGGNLASSAASFDPEKMQSRHSRIVSASQAVAELKAKDPSNSGISRSREQFRAAAVQLVPEFTKNGQFAADNADESPVGKA